MNTQHDEHTLSGGHSDVRATLCAVDQAVVVPTYDASGVAARTRTLRRRRRTAGALAAAAVVAVGAVGIGLLPGALPGEDSDSVVVDGAGGSAAAVPAGSGVPVVLDGAVRLVGADGSVSDTGLRGQVVGVVDDRVVVLDGDRLVGAGDDPIEGVTAAYADPSGVTYQLADGTVDRAGAGGLGATGVSGRLVGASVEGFATQEGVVVTLHDRTGAHRLDLGSDGSAFRTERVQVGGGTAVVADASTVNLFDLDGTRRTGFLGGTTGALSPDGRTYAYGPTAQDVALGADRGVQRFDTDTERTTARTALPGAAVDLAWSGDDLYVLTQDGDTRTLWQCVATCEQRYVDEGGTLSLR